MPKSASRGFTILSTARDPGSAHQAAAFVRGMRRRHPECALQAVATGPAFSILAASGCPVRRWPHGPKAGRRVQIETALRLLKRVRPDAVMLGLAFPGFGPDEALFAAASRRRIPTACIQDYWGYLGSFRRGAAPEIFFVQDELAAKLTRRKLGTKTRVVVTGSPRHLAARPRLRRPERAAADRPRIVFIGQPPRFQACRENLAHFATALAQVKRPCDILFRRHPNDRRPDTYYERLFARQPHRFTIEDPSEPAERTLTNADLVVTCFSSVGLDHHYLQLSSRALLAPVLFVTIGKNVRRLLRRHVGLPIVPNVALKMAAGASTPRALIAALKSLPGNRAVAQRYRKRITAVLAPRADPCEVMYTALQSASRAAR